MGRKKKLEGKVLQAKTYEKALSDWQDILKQRVEWGDGFKEKTVITYMNNMKPFTFWLNMTGTSYLDLDSEKLMSFKTWLLNEKSYSMASLQGFFITYKIFYDYLVDCVWSKLKTNEIQSFKKKHIKIGKKAKAKKADEKALEWDQVEEILSLNMPLKYKALIAYLAGTGSRLSEAMRLLRRHMRYNEKQLVYDVFVMTSKTDELRKTYFLDTDLQQYVLEWCGYLKKLRLKNLNPYEIYKYYHPQLIFNFPRNSFQVYLEKTVSRQVGYRVTAHGLRYAFIGEHIKRGTPIYALSRLVGHTNEHMTAFYDRVKKTIIPEVAYDALNYDVSDVDIYSANRPKILKKKVMRV